MTGPHLPLQQTAGREEEKGRKKRSGWKSLVIVATETKGAYQLPIFFSVAGAETPPQVSPW